MADLQIQRDYRECQRCHSLLKCPFTPTDHFTCSHVYCFVCIEQILEEELYLKSPKCPECQADLMIRSGDIPDMDGTNKEVRNCTEIQREGGGFGKHGTDPLAQSSQAIGQLCVTRPSRGSDIASDMMVGTNIQVCESDNNDSVHNRELIPDHADDIDSGYQNVRNYQGSHSDHDPTKSMTQAMSSHASRHATGQSEQQSLHENTFQSAEIYKEGVATRNASGLDTVICRDETVSFAGDIFAEKPAMSSNYNNIPLRINKGIDSDIIAYTRHVRTDNSFDIVSDISKVYISEPFGEKKSDLGSATHMEDDIESSGEYNSDNSGFPQPGAAEIKAHNMKPMGESCASSDDDAFQVSSNYENVHKETPQEPVRKCDVPSGGAAKSDRNCHVHTGEKILVYCLSCAEQICAMCLVANHLDHDVLKLAEAAFVVREQLQAKLQTALIHKEVWKDRLIKLKDLETSFRISLDNECERIDNYTMEYVNFFRKEENNPLDIDSMASHMEDVAKSKRCMQNQIHILETALKSAASSSTMADGGTINRQSRLLQQLRGARKQAATICSAVNDLCTSYETTQFGRFVSVPKIDLIQQFDGFEGANSVAFASNGNLLVGDVRCKNVQLYHKQDGCYVYDSILTQFKPSFGVGATADNRYLVATDTDIMMFSPCSLDDTMRQCSFFSSTAAKAGADMGCVRVIHDRLFIAHSRKPFITEYDSTGCPLKTTMIEHIAKSFTLAGKSRVAVIYQGGVTVHVVDFESKLDKRVPQRCINLDTTLQPISMCYDDKSNCLLIGSCTKSSSKPGQLFKVCTGVIDQYCCITGQFVARLTEGLYSVRSMSITADRSCLAVADELSLKFYSIG